MAATNPLVTSVLMVDLISWGLVATMGLGVRCPSTASEALLPGIVLWFSLFFMMAVVWPRGGAGSVLVEHCPSARSVALFAATWLGSGMPFDSGCDFLALQGAERSQGSRQLLLYVFSVTDLLSIDSTKLASTLLVPTSGVGC